MIENSCVNNIFIIINLLISFLFGSLIGFSELLQRYNYLKYIFKSKMSYVYIFLNGIVSVIALLIIKNYKNPDNNLFFNNIEIIDILISCLCGMLILRSYLFSIKIKDETVEIGLSKLFQIFLNIVEKKMKNQAAALKFNKINEIMKDVDFSLAVQGLPVICHAFIENFSVNDEETLFKKINEIINMPNNNDEEKTLLLGNIISQYCDEELLEEVISRYKKSYIDDQIKSRINVLNSQE